MSLYTYRGHVRRVIDGDTLELQVELGFYVSKIVRVRIAGIDAPELRGADREQGKAARDALYQWFAEVEAAAVKADSSHRSGGVCDCTLRSFKGRSFGRWVASVDVMPDPAGEPVSVADWMVEHGHAKGVE